MYVYSVYNIHFIQYTVYSTLYTGHCDMRRCVVDIITIGSLTITMVSHHRYLQIPVQLEKILSIRCRCRRSVEIDGLQERVGDGGSEVATGRVEGRLGGGWGGGVDEREISWYSDIGVYTL